MRCLLQGGYRERTQRNVIDSDGTLIIHYARLAGGTRLTQKFCIDNRKPLQVVDAEKVPIPQAIRLLHDFVEEYAIRVLNVAGPRESGWPGAAVYSRRLIRSFLQAALR